MSTKVPQDQAVRSRLTTDLDTSFIVEAAAGTGKTTVLVSRIVAVVRTGRARLEQLIAVTFTEKAAGEMKLRLREALELARGDATALEQTRLTAALEELEVARVSTIHGLCADLLREYPIEAKVDPLFEVASEDDAEALLDATFSRWFQGVLSNPGEGVRRLLRRRPRYSDEQTPRGHLFDALRRLVEHRDFDGPWRRAPFARDAALDALVLRLTELGALIDRVREAPDDSWFLDALREVRRFTDDLAHRETLSPRDHDGLEALLHGLRSHRAWAYRPYKVAFEGLTTDQAVALRDAVYAELNAFLAGADADLAACLHEELQPVLPLYETEKSQAGYLDFVDLLLRTRDLVRGNHDVRRALQQRFTHLFVDEFQDTDPLQTEIVFFLAERTPRATVWREVEVTPGKLFLVGDPKQSIYRFRRADIELYDEAKRALLQQGDGLDLQTNFRSRRSLVDWVNERFRGLIRRPPSESYQPDYVALAPPPELPRDDGPTVHLLSLPAPVATAELPADQAKRDRTEWLRVEARLVAEYLAELVRAREPLRVDGGARPLGYRDVAILFRDNDAMQWYEDELRDRDIPYRVAGGRRFYGRDEVTALLALIRAVANPKDQVNLVAALRAPFFGFSDEQLYLFKSSGGVFDYLRPVREQVDGSPAFANAFGLLRRLHQRGLEVRPALWLSTVFDELPHLLPLLYLRPQGDQRVANLFKLIDIARAVEAEGVSSLRGLGRFLADLERLQAEEGESPVAEESDDVVRLMTIHKAKGLEFPVVVLADGQRKLSSQTPIGISDRVTGELALRIGKARTGNWERLKEWERPRGEAEEIRLLYVAATRARDHLVLPLYPRADRGDFLGRLVDGEGEQVEVVDPAPYDLQARPVRAFRKAFATLAEAAPDPRAVAAADAWASARAKQIAAGARGPRFRNPSRLAHAGQESGQQELAFGRRDGARVGSLVHAVLQRIDLADPSGLDAVVRGLADAAAVAGAGVEQACDLARRALAMPVLARARAAETCHREVPFTWPVGEGAVEGVIDLVFRERGRLVIVDYKTDDVRPGRALDERVAGYRGQAVIYAAALEAITGESVKEVVLAFLRLGVEKRLRAADWRAGAERLLAPSQNGIEAGAEF